MEIFNPDAYGLQNSGQPWSFLSDGLLARFEVRGGDKWGGDTPDRDRSEIVTYDRLAFGETYNISYKMLVAQGAPNSADWMLLGQVHQSEDPGDLAVSPPFAIQLVGERLQVVARADASPTTTSWPGTIVLYTSPTDIVRGDWYQFDLKIRFDPFGNGLVDLKINGQQVVSYAGAIGYNDAQGGYWKEGIYREASPETTTVYYYDTTVLTNAEAANHATVGGDGNDVLRGTLGGDIFKGGLGNDTYSVNHIYDLVIEVPNSGIDLVYSTIDYVLPANVENLSLTALGPINGWGNDLANIVTGNEAANALMGWGGDDILKGNGGNDWISGGEGKDYITGGAGNDVIWGGPGADQIYGGPGADWFYFDGLNDFALGSQMDVISDFSHAEGDIIDVSHLDANPYVEGDQAFIFVGVLGAFHGQAGELGYLPGNGYSTVLGDINGDGIADFQLRVYSAAALVASDFAL